MKKLSVLFLSALVLCLAPSRAGASSDKLKEMITRVESCEAVLQDFQRRPETAIPPGVFAKARAIVIVNQFKAGLLLGIQDGYGVILVKRADGRWSLPALIKAGEASLGLQLGASTVETIYIITDDQTPRLLFRQRINIGVDAKAVAGVRFKDNEKDNLPIMNVPVLVYTKKKGLFAGATVKTGFIKRDDSANRILYKTNFNLPELLYSDWVEPIPEVQPLMALVQRLAP
ncbi:MAG: lipid-binding SYLF domain-containing protein [Opitutaceae bacterium]|jgi:lipid-binding SYLF domain-containing protein